MQQDPDCYYVVIHVLQLQMMTPIRIPYIEKALDTSINTLEGFENHKCKLS